jgi:MinD superfamily P-loop ATPase
LISDMSKKSVIAVASGKGGTGKTTIATNLARYLANLGRKVRYLDCDVEEPNGHIFLKPQITDRQPVTVHVPEVNLEKCTACGKCGEICQFSAILCIKENVLTFEQLCHSCGGCWRICPAGAIEPKPLRIGDIEFGKAGDIDFVAGRLEIGHVRTPAMIREVKKNTGKGDLTIIDVPPGTSCPVVEAVKGTDFVLLVTEPTPFGLNDLRLAVGLVREMNLPFAVVVNRCNLGDTHLYQYCRQEIIEVALEIRDDRRIAEAYSVGKMIVDALPEYQEDFARLYETVSKAIKS